MGQICVLLMDQTILFYVWPRFFIDLRAFFFYFTSVVDLILFYLWTGFWFLFWLYVVWLVTEINLYKYIFCHIVTSVYNPSCSSICLFDTALSINSTILSWNFFPNSVRYSSWWSLLIPISGAHLTRDLQWY